MNKQVEQEQIILNNLMEKGHLKRTRNLKEEDIIVKDLKIPNNITNNPNKLNKLNNPNKLNKLNNPNKLNKLNNPNKTETEEKWTIYEVQGASYIVTTLQHIYAFGNNKMGRLGIKTKNDVDVPTRVELDLYNEEGIKSIMGFEECTFIITTENRIYATGCNEEGELGINCKTQYIYTPTQVKLDLKKNEGIKTIQNEGECTFILTTENRIYATGKNSGGCLGINCKKKNIYNPTEVKLTLKQNEGIKFLIGNDGTTFIITTENRIYASGSNVNGQLGINCKEKYIYNPTEVKLTLKQNEVIKSIYKSWHSTFITTSEKKIYGMGNNDKGQLGINSDEKKILIPREIKLTCKNDEEIKLIYSTWDSTYFLTTASRIYATGSNDLGQIGIGAQEEIKISSPKQIKLSLNENEEIEAIYKYYDSTFIATSMGRIFAFGNNTFGKLGVDSKEESIFKPILIPLKLSNDEKIKNIDTYKLVTFITTTSNKIYATGSNNKGQMGINSEEEIIYAPILVHTIMNEDEEIISIFNTFAFTTYIESSERCLICGKSKLSF